MTNAGLFIPHDSFLCPGNFFYPSVITRMSWVIVRNSSTPYIPAGCDSNLYADNAALSMYQNAYLSVPFYINLPGYIDLYLNVGGTTSFYPTVQVNGTTYLSTTGSVRVTLTSAANTLVFSIVPAGAGTLPDHFISLAAQIG